MEDVQLNGHYWNKADKAYKYEIEYNKDFLKCQKCRRQLKTDIYNDLKYLNWRLISDIENT